MKNNTRAYILVFICASAFFAMLFVPPIIQDPAFHNFADGREIASIPNFWNVFSNLPFLVLGAAGLWMSVNGRPGNSPAEPEFNRILFFAGIIFTGIGSAYYHLHPNDHTLVWDRLPMTIAFMSFFSIVIEEIINERSGRKILWHCLAFGVIAIVYWVAFGDLRLYALVQFLPMLLIPVILLMYPDNIKIKKYFWLVAATYLMAKLCEAGDKIIFDSLILISGHTLKHLFAAAAPLIIILGMKKKVL